MAGTRARKNAKQVDTGFAGDGFGCNDVHIAVKVEVTDRSYVLPWKYAADECHYPRIVDPPEFNCWAAIWRMTSYEEFVLIVVVAIDRKALAVASWGSVSLPGSNRNEAIVPNVNYLHVACRVQVRCHEQSVVSI